MGHLLCTSGRCQPLGIQSASSVSTSPQSSVTAVPHLIDAVTKLTRTRYLLCAIVRCFASFDLFPLQGAMTGLQWRQLISDRQLDETVALEAHL